MEKYLREVLDDFPEDITETSETPATSNLFNIRDDNKRELLNKTRAQAFHHTVAQLIFTGIRYRKDAHDDMWGHTGGTIPMGKDGRGSIISTSKKQKLNTKSPTDAGLIGADDAMPDMLWKR